MVLLLTEQKKLLAKFMAATRPHLCRKTINYFKNKNGKRDKNFGSLGVAVKAPNILCHQCAKAL